MVRLQWAVHGPGHQLSKEVALLTEPAGLPRQISYAITEELSWFDVEWLAVQHYRLWKTLKALRVYTFELEKIPTEHAGCPTVIAWRDEFLLVFAISNFFNAVVRSYTLFPCTNTAGGWLAGWLAGAVDKL